MKEFYEPKDWLPDWGPYSKKYMGVSKVGVKGAVPATRFDCVVHPMLANSNQPAPNVTFPANYHVWEAAPDLSYYAYRVEMEWKDQVYADVSFSKADDHTRLIRTEYVNRTDMDQNCVLNYYLAMEYPWKQNVQIHSKGSFVWKKVVDYDSMAYQNPYYREHLMPDGLHQCEFFDPDFVGGRGFGERIDFGALPHAVSRFWGKDKGDRVEISIAVDTKYDLLTLRYRTTEPEEAQLTVTAKDSGGKIYDVQRIYLASTEVLDLYSVPLNLPSEDCVYLEIVSEGKGGVEFDFAALCQKDTPIWTEITQPGFVPERIETEDGYLLRYPKVEEIFGFCSMGEKVRVRDIPTGCLEDALISRLSQADETFDQVTKTFTSAFEEKHSDDGFYQNFIVHSIFIPAGARHVEYALVGDGEQKQISVNEAETIYEKARAAAGSFSLNPDGEVYSFSNRMLQATLLTNIVYPIYRHGTWIKHHTPGKRWDSLYTWDSGFIGLGLLECEPKLAEYILDLYLSTEENPDFAFLMHGSPVPVQAYLYLELLQRSNDKEKLFAWYPRMKRYYTYLAGKSEGSVTDPFESRMTTTFDYFYNCSGMDDLPPQVAMYERKLQADCAPALTTSQLIRMAKILRMIAKEQGMEEEVKEFNEDIELCSKALQTYAWDEESGYFGYVVHDKEKRPTGILRTEEGENLSKGMDGIYPLVAGVCTREQEEKLLEHIFSEKEMFSRVGISAVDMSASYYQPNGYWNGNVWFSHQWFIWKTMFDLGKTEEAYRIAKTALEAWKKEVEHSYYTFEMLNIATGRGGWYHQFGGLSAPVNVWADAYYKPGTVTGGFEVWIADQNYNKEQDSYHMTVTNYADRPISLLAVLGSQGEKNAVCTINGQPVPVTYRTKGAIEIQVPVGLEKGCILING